MAMKETTPYHERPAREIEREVACMRTIFRKAPPTEMIWEAFGGTGQTTRALLDIFPSAVIVACDLDQACVDAYNRVSPHFASSQVADARTFDPGQVEGVSLDFNKFTIYDLRKRTWKRDLVERAAGLASHWVQITDSAVRYFHLNWHRYGLAERSLAQYVDAVAREVEPMGLQLVAWDNHHAATYILFKKV